MTIQLTFRDFPPTDAVRAHVERHANKLVTRYQPIAVKIALSAPHHHHLHGNSYRVRIDVVMPGSELVVTPRDGEEGHADLYAAIEDAFDDAERRLREHARILRGDLKTRAAE